LRARAIALSFSGGTIGAVMMPLLLGPLAIQYGWRSAFIATAGLGAAWLVIWAIMKLIQRSKGVDTSMLFAEIPPD